MIFLPGSPPERGLSVYVSFIENLRPLATSITEVFAERTQLVDARTAKSLAFQANGRRAPLQALCDAIAEAAAKGGG